MKKKKLTFEISEDKLIQVMMLYAEKYHPELTYKFNTKLKVAGRGNSGWGSQMHDYTYYVTEYWSSDGVKVLEEYDNRDRHSDTKWYVNEEFEPIYTLFGLEAFQNFFLKVHNIDLTKKGNKRDDWMFDSLDSN